MAEGFQLSRVRLEPEYSMGLHECSRAMVGAMRYANSKNVRSSTVIQEVRSYAEHRMY